jgi:hypothetical protein
LLIFTSTIAQTSYDVTSVDGRYQLCDQLGISEWNGIEIDGNVVRIGRAKYYKNDKDEGYGYYRLSESWGWDPVGSISINRSSATITWRRMKCPVTLVTPEEKKRKEAEKSARRERVKKEKIAADKKQYYKIDKALKNKQYSDAVSLAYALNFSSLYPNQSGLKTAKLEVRKLKDSLIVQKITNSISQGNMDDVLKEYRMLSSSKRDEMKSTISKEFQMYYETKPIILSTTKIKKIIDDNKQVFSTFNDGTYKVEIGIDGILKGLPSKLSIEPIQYESFGFECKRPCEFQLSIETNTVGVCLSKYWKSSFDQANSKWNFYTAEKKGERMIIGGYFTTPPKKYSNVEKINLQIDIVYDNSCSDDGNKKGKLIFSKKYFNDGNEIYSNLTKSDDCITNKWLWKGAFTAGY